jgi:hypothetical protein
MSIEKYSKIQIKPSKHLREQIELRRNRINNIAFMDEIRENQTRNTYTVEYDRIRNSLANSATSYDNKEVIERRLNA